MAGRKTRLFTFENGTVGATPPPRSTPSPGRSRTYPNASWALPRITTTSVRPAFRAAPCWATGSRPIYDPSPDFTASGTAATYVNVANGSPLDSPAPGSNVGLQFTSTGAGDMTGQGFRGTFIIESAVDGNAPANGANTFHFVHRAEPGLGPSGSRRQRARRRPPGPSAPNSAPHASRRMVFGSSRPRARRRRYEHQAGQFRPMDARRRLTHRRRRHLYINGSRRRHGQRLLQQLSLRDRPRRRQYAAPSRSMGSSTTSRPSAPRASASRSPPTSITSATLACPRPAASPATSIKMATPTRPTTSSGRRTPASTTLSARAI